jgi:hypothetical protein
VQVLSPGFRRTKERKNVAPDKARRLPLGEPARGNGDAKRGRLYRAPFVSESEEAKD